MYIYTYCVYIYIYIYISIFLYIYIYTIYINTLYIYIKWCCGLGAVICSPRLVADGLELRHDAAVGVAQGLQAWRRRKTRDVELLVEADLCTVSVCIYVILHIYIYTVYIYILYIYIYICIIRNVSSDDNSMYGIVSLWMNVLSC